MSKILLDENLPCRLKEVFHEHEVFTLYEMGRSGETDLDVLWCAFAREFTAFVTANRMLPHGRHPDRLAFPCFILSGSGSRVSTLRPLAQAVLTHLEQAQPGTITLITA